MGHRSGKGELSEALKESIAVMGKRSEEEGEEVTVIVFQGQTIERSVVGEPASPLDFYL